MSEKIVPDVRVNEIPPGGIYRNQPGRLVENA